MFEPQRWSPYRPPAPFVPPVRLDPTGRQGPTPGAARGKHWERTGPGLYVPAGVDRTLPEQRIADAAAQLPPDGAITGWGALRMAGAAFLDGLAPDGRTPLRVPAVVPAGCHRREQRGIRFVQGGPDEVVMIQGIPCRPVRAALFDQMRLAEDPREAVVAMDMTAAAGLTSVRRMTRYLERRTSWRGVPGVPQVRWALRLADERSVSPPETRLRLVWVLDARLPRPLVNEPVFDLSGNLLGYPDLLDPAAGLVGEYDGDDHRRARRHSHDVDREADFRGAGLEVTRVTSLDLQRREALVRRLHAARGRARFAPAGQREWTSRRPAWFRPREPVDVVLDRLGIDGD